MDDPRPLIIVRISAVSDDRLAVGRNGGCICERPSGESGAQAVVINENVLKILKLVGLVPDVGSLWLARK